MEELIEGFRTWSEAMVKMGSRVNQEAWDTVENVIYYAEALIDEGRSEVDHKNLEEWRAMALVNFGRIHSRYDLTEEAIAIYDEVYLEHRNHSNAAIRFQAMRGLVNSGVAYVSIDKMDRAIEAWDEAGEKYYNDPHKGLQTAALRAMQNKSIALDLYKYEGAGDPVREVMVERFQNSRIPAIQKDLLQFFYEINWIGTEEQNPALKALFNLVFKKNTKTLEPESLKIGYYLLDTPSKELVCQRVLELKYRPFFLILLGGESLSRPKGHYPFERTVIEAFILDKEFQELGQKLILQTEMDWGIQLLAHLREKGGAGAISHPLIRRLDQQLKEMSIPTISSWSLEVQDHTPMGHRETISAWFFSDDLIITADRSGRILLWPQEGSPRELPPLKGSPRKVFSYQGNIGAVLWNQRGLFLFQEEKWAPIEEDYLFRDYSREGHLLLGEEGLYSLEKSKMVPIKGIILAYRSKGRDWLLSEEGILHYPGGQIKSDLPSKALPLQSASLSQKLDLLGNDGVFYRLHPQRGTIESSYSLQEPGIEVISHADIPYIAFKGEQKISLYTPEGELLFSQPGVSLALQREGCFLGDKKGKIHYLNYQGELLTLLEGHSDWVVDLELSGDFLYSFGLEGTIRRWHRDSLTLNHVWGGLSLLSLDYYKGRLLQIWNGGVRILDKGDKLLCGMQGVLTAYARGEQHLVMGSLAGEVQVFKGDRLLWSSQEEGYPESFLIVDKFLWTGLSNGELIQYNLSNGKKIWQKDFHKEGITILEVHPGGEYLFTGSRDRDIGILKFSDYSDLPKLAMHTLNLTSLKFADQGRILLSSGDDGLILKWDWLKGALLDIIKESKTPVWDLITNQEGNILSARVDDNDLTLWNLPYGVKINSLRGHRAQISSLRFFPGEGFMASGSSDRSVRIWKMPEGRVVKKLSPGFGPIQSLALKEDGMILAVGSGSGQIQEFNLTPFILYTQSLAELQTRKISLRGMGFKEEEEDKKAFLRFLRDWMKG